MRLSSIFISLAIVLLLSTTLLSVLFHRESSSPALQRVVLQRQPRHEQAAVATAADDNVSIALADEDDDHDESDAAHKTPVLHVVSHTHWDREWYLSFQVFRLKLLEVVDDVLERIAQSYELEARGGATADERRTNDIAHFRHFLLDGATAPLMVCVTMHLLG